MIHYSLTKTIYLILKKPALLNIPDVLMISPKVLMVSPNVLTVSSYVLSKPKGKLGFEADSHSYDPRCV